MARFNETRNCIGASAALDVSSLSLFPVSTILYFLVHSMNGGGEKESGNYVQSQDLISKKGNR